MGRPVKTVNEIVRGRKSIAAEAALQLERELGGVGAVLVNTQARHDTARCARGGGGALAAKA